MAIYLTDNEKHETDTNTKNICMFMWLYLKLNRLENIQTMKTNNKAIPRIIR